MNDEGDAFPRAVGAPLLASALLAAPILVLVPCAPGLASWADQPATAVGGLFSCALVGAGTGVAAIVGWACRNAPLSVLRASLPLAALLAAAVAAAPAWASLQVGLAALFAAAACGAFAATALLARGSRSPRRSIGLQYAIAAGLGVAVPGTIGWLVHGSDGESVRRLFGLAMGLDAAGLLALAAWAWHAPVAQPAVVADRPAASPRSALVSVGLLAGLHAGADTTLYLWAPSLLASLPGPAPVPPAWILSAFALSYLVGRTTLTLLPDRSGERTLVVAPGLAAASLLLVAFGGAVAFVPAFVLLMLASLCYGLEYPSLLGLIARRDPDRFPRQLAACTLGGAVGNIVVSAPVAWLAPTIGLAPALLIAPAAFAAFSVLAWRLAAAPAAGPVRAAA